MSLSTTASRVTGFVRTWAWAVALGVTFGASKVIPVASSYFVANNIPNMIYELVAGGVLSSLFIPLFMERLVREGDQSAHRFANLLFSMALVFLGVVAFVGTLFPQPFVFTQTFTVSRQEAALAVYLFRFFAVQIVFYGWCAIATGVLNSRRHFFAPAIAPLVNNVVVIVALLGFYVPLRESRPDLAVVALGVGTTLGVVALLLTQIPALLSTGFRFRWAWDLRDATLRKMLRKAAPVLGYVIVNLVGVSFRNAFAINAFKDGPAVLTYAWMWYQLPYGVLAVAYVTALFPELSEMAGTADWTRFKTTVSRGLRVMGLLMLPMAAMLVALAEPLVRIYQSGEFPARAVPLVAGVLTVWAFGLFSFAAFMLTLRAFYARQDTMTPMITNAILTVVQVGLYWGLTSVTAWGQWRLLGIPAADATFFTLHAIVLLAILRRQAGAFDGRKVLSALARVTAASAAGGAVAYAARYFTPALTASRLGFVVQLLVGGIAGLVTAYGIVALLRVDEVHEATAMARRVLGRIVPRRATS